jgi:hypothetical protein
MSIARHNEKLSAHNMDYYYQLDQKRTLLTEISKRYFHGKLIDICCGEMPYKGIVVGNSRVAEQAKFEVVKMESFFCLHASMASMIALYCRRGLHRNRFQSILSKILFPAVRYLMKKDVHFPKDRFYEGQMITGISCLLKKK